VSLRPQAQRLNTEQELLRRKGIQRGAQVSQDLDARADDEGDGAESLPEFQAVVSVRGLDHLRESRAVLAPVELAAVDDDATDCRAMAADPFCGRVDDYVGAVVDWPDEIAACTESVVDLSLLAPKHFPCERAYENYLPPEEHQHHAQP
jgi:hypothetical protein